MFTLRLGPPIKLLATMRLTARPFCTVEGEFRMQIITLGRELSFGVGRYRDESMTGETKDGHR